MPEPLTGVVVLIASPSDTTEERAALRDALTDWNINNGRRQNIATLPWLWERHAVAALGDRPQALINEQAVNRSDVVIAVFGSRLGTSTGVDVSGTAEEIDRALGQGKPVHVYFSTEPIPHDADLQQVAALRGFKESLQEKGLLGEYSDSQDLVGQVVRALQYDIDNKSWGSTTSPAPSPSGAQLVWTHDHRKEQKGLDKRGRVQYRTLSNALVVSNEGNVAAENLMFTVEGIDDALVKIDVPSDPQTLHPNSDLRWICIPLHSGNIKVSATWTEDGDPKEAIRTVSVTG